MHYIYIYIFIYLHAYPLYPIKHTPSIPFRSAFFETSQMVPATGCRLQGLHRLPSQLVLAGELLALRVMVCVYIYYIFMYIYRIIHL